MNFQDGNFQHAKSFRMKCVNHFCEKKKRINSFCDKKVCANHFCNKKVCVNCICDKKVCVNCICDKKRFKKDPVLYFERFRSGRTIGEW